MPLGIVRFARSLKMQTVAKLVHSAAVQEKVLALGIDYPQGQHIGMPQAQLRITPEMTDTAPALS